MWRLHAPDEIKVLIWLIFHNCLPTNKLLFKRNIISDPLCSRCSYIGDREEYTLFKRLFLLDKSGLLWESRTVMASGEQTSSHGSQILQQVAYLLLSLQDFGLYGGSEIV